MKEWHESFGHLGCDYISRLEKRSLVDGLKITRSGHVECSSCNEGKMTRKRQETARSGAYLTFVRVIDETTLSTTTLRMMLPIPLTGIDRPCAKFTCQFTSLKDTKADFSWIIHTCRQNMTVLKCPLCLSLKNPNP